jgi:predicted TIM-barrel fold metal-dependent hydrolase
VIIDGHAHIFAPPVIANVSGRPALVDKLRLDISGAQQRISPAALQAESRPAGVDACLLLPVATVDKVREINTAFREMAAESDFFFTAGTLHPQFSANEEELLSMYLEGVRAIKLCSFSQGFSVPAAKTQDLFRLIEERNRLQNHHFFVILDTLYLAHTFFGTAPEFDTTPAMLGDVVKAYPGIDFLLAHMGGLAAPAEEIFRHLPPAENLYLDTSCAAYTLSEEEFVGLLKIHGPGHIIFGTDWPWFGHRQELKLIDMLLDRAGFESEEKQKVFCRNAAGLLGIHLPDRERL